MEDNLTPQAPSGVDKTVHGPKALFWYLTLFFTLGITAFNIGGLWFQFINKWVPQEVSSGYVQAAFSQTTLKIAIASLLIATPLYYLFSVFIRKALKNNNLDPKNKVRVWISYIILFITVAIAIGDLITTVFRVLDGDFTLRFILKSLAILIIVGAIFIYYWLELRSPDSLVSSKLPKTMGIIAGVIIAVSFIGSFFIIDSPATARAKAYDSTRISDLQQIKYNTENYYSNYGQLPESLAALKDYSVISITDPQTKNEYEYKVVDAKSYQLCADFQTSNKLDENNADYPKGYDGFAHDQGHTCFDLKINEQIDPGNLKPMAVPR